MEIHGLRDLTRGGLAGALVEIAEAGAVPIEIEEDQVPVCEEVRGACEILGLGSDVRRQRRAIRRLCPVGPGGPRGLDPSLPRQRKQCLPSRFRSRRSGRNSDRPNGRWAHCGSSICSAASNSHESADENREAAQSSTPCRDPFSNPVVKTISDGCSTGFRPVDSERMPAPHGVLLRRSVHTGFAERENHRRRRACPRPDAATVDGRG